jgi:Kef-type K+ transport system membrane component KefB
LLAAKLVLKSAAVYPLARRYARPHAAFTTLLMSTGLTFGTISATYGYTAGIIDKAQFSVLVTVVVLTAIIPTAIAQRRFSPAVPADDRPGDRAHGVAKAASAAAIASDDPADQRRSSSPGRRP